MGPSLKDPNIPRAPLAPATSDKAYNALVDHVGDMTRTLAAMVGAAPDDRPVIREIFLAQTSDNAPSGQNAFSAKDARYWLNRSVPLNNKTTDKFGVQLDEFRKVGLYDATVPGVNLAELFPQASDSAPANSGGTHLLPPKTPVLVFAISARTSPLKKFYVFVRAPNIGAIFRVNLTQTGGSNGTQSTAPTYTYTATDLNSNQLGTGLSPERPRPNGAVTAATKGTGYYNTSGTFVLAEAWETPGSGHC